jgi:dTDP-4-amino-4,6-dideoxygalactose transaminase
MDTQPAKGDMLKTTAAAATPSIPMLDLKAQYNSIKDEIRSAIDGVLEAQHFILGENVRTLEADIAKYCGRRFGVGVASGTDALILALKVAGVGEGHEVIVPSFTFIATADAVSALNATPVFVDIDPETFTIDVKQIEAKITARTKAIIPVHLYGQSADMDAILALAAKHGIRVIEDNAQALGSTYKGRKTAGMGDLGCISFFPSKNLGAYGDAGMVVTDSEEMYKHLISVRAHGSTKKYFSEEQGWNSRLDELQAAILKVKLRYLDEWNKGRAVNAEKYNRALAGMPGVVTPKTASWGTHVFHQYTVRVRNREQVAERLKNSGVPTMVYYPHAIHLQPIYRELGYREGQLPETERACKEALSLPIYPELTQEQVEYVARQLREAM